MIGTGKTKQVDHRAGPAAARQRIGAESRSRSDSDPRTDRLTRAAQHREAGVRTSKTSRDPVPSRQARRVSHVKREQREQRQRVMRLRRAIALCVAIVLVGLAAWGLVSLTRLPAVGIADIEVSGTKHLAAETVISLARIERGSSLVWLPKRKVAQRIRSNPWVGTVRIDRGFPRTVLIDVVERTPALVVDNGGSRLWVVSTDGRWLGERGPKEAELPVVRDADVPDPKAGTAVDSPEIRNAVDIVAGLSDELLANTRVISAPSIEKTALITNDDVEVFLGDAADIRMKDRIVREILRAQEGKVVYINVRVVESPTWRGLDQ